MDRKRCPQFGKWWLVLGGIGTEFLPIEYGGKHSMSNRKEKKEENREGTQTSKHPNGYPKLEVFEKAATKKDDHNHRNSLQR